MRCVGKDSPNWKIPSPSSSYPGCGGKPKKWIEHYCPECGKFRGINAALLEGRKIEELHLKHRLCGDCNVKRHKAERAEMAAICRRIDARKAKRR